MLFGILKHKYTFQRLRKLWILQKFYEYLFIPNCTGKNHVITDNNVLASRLIIFPVFLSNYGLKLLKNTTILSSTPLYSNVDLNLLQGTLVSSLNKQTSGWELGSYQFPFLPSFSWNSFFLYLTCKHLVCVRFFFSKETKQESEVYSRSYSWSCWVCTLWETLPGVPQAWKRQKGLEVCEKEGENFLLNYLFMLSYIKLINERLHIA